MKETPIYDTIITYSNLCKLRGIKNPTLIFTRARIDLLKEELHYYERCTGKLVKEDRPTGAVFRIDGVTIYEDLRCPVKNSDYSLSVNYLPKQRRSDDIR